MNLNQITVSSVNLSKAIPFYQTLGLTLIVESQPHYARFICPDGTSTFSIHLVDQIQDREGISVYFECEHLDQTVEKLQEKGIKFESLPEDKPWLWREAHLYDPDHNHLILYYAGENRLNPPWRIQN